MKNKKLLIGFVNQFFTPRLNLGILDLMKNNFQWIFNEQIEQHTKNVQGVNGLAIYKDFLFVGYQSNPTKILIFDSKFNIVKTLEIEQIKQLHSFTFLNDKLYCISTGTNEIYELRFDNNLNIKTVNNIYSYSNIKEDIIHINSISNYNGKLIATCFGEKENKSWKNAREGKLFYVDSNEIILNGLFQPHSSYSFKDNWVVCESGTGKLIFKNKKKVNLGGYVRGIIYDDFLYVGLSGKRIKSRSKGTLNVGTAKSINESKSLIKILDIEKLNVLETIDVSLYGAEIFDLKILPEEFFYQDFSNPLEIQIQQLEDKILNLESELLEKTLRKMILKKIKFIKS